MMAKIVKGRSFSGVVNYVLDPEKQAELLDSQGLRTKSGQSIIESFRLQTQLNQHIQKPVGHISLDFSPKDKEKLNGKIMVQIAGAYMKGMGIENTQYLLVRHYDKEHPHVHLVFNRVDNDGKTISDRNDRYRSEKICKDLTRRFHLYFAAGKEQVKTHRLREPDKTRYCIYGTLKTALPDCKSWDDVIERLKQEEITVEFKLKGKTAEVQGVIFGKNGYSFSGSKVDRRFSFSKITEQLERNREKLTPTQDNRCLSERKESPVLGNYLGSLVRAVERQNERERQQERRLPTNRPKRRKGRRI
ncbi:relaxase/mobilization nuclease domain-containing protein [Gaoshiqia sediminis]|uniref:Relaxase/mobilization nuclease domain-containing protein n=1 Tax=Gaoshiqia sediminis TaxID=2986998 RepID=A0AA42CA83_9BACT|nr:relaxase/mobilization nuclease domain-containing protein [Gaoshiqia sediminis]MCW0485041.1 relaxase/mobilization nuclease domain-containing protein [Gaoshiqia sediminis]